MEEAITVLREKWAKMATKLPKEPFYPFGKIPIHEYLSRYAKEIPEKEFLIYYGRRISFKEMDRLSNGFANFLLSEGFKKGDRVALILPNCPQFYIGYFGTLKAGGVAVLLNPILRELELEYFFGQSKPRLVFALDQVAPSVEKALSVLGDVKLVVTSLSDFLSESPELELLSLAKSEEGLKRGLKFSEIELDSTKPSIEVTIEDYATMNFTGGTTGLPKPVLHRHLSAIYKGACMLTYSNASEYSGEEIKNFITKIREKWVSLAVMPIFWIAGFDFGVVTPTIGGTTVVLLTRWSPKTAVSAIKLFKVTDTYMTFDMYWEILNLNPNPEDMRSLRNCTGSSFVRGLSKELRAKWRELTGTVLREASYGLTETHTYDTVTAKFQEEDLDLERAEKYGATFCGIPCPETLILVVDEDGKPCRPEKSGEIIIKSPSLVEGYVGRPEETEKSFRNGWFFTGDIGMFDEDGFFYYLSRKKDMLKVSGISVYPAQIEFMLLKHPLVESCAVIGQKDPEKGQVPVAFVKLRKNLSEKELIEWCRERMASFNVPKRIIIKERLPMTATGKIIKEELKKELESLYFQK